MFVGQNIEVRTEADGRVALVFDPAKVQGRSKSGKSSIIATTGGNQTIPVPNGVVTVGLNVYTK